MDNCNKEFELDQYARDALTLFIGYILDYFETDKNQNAGKFLE